MVAVVAEEAEEEAEEEMEEVEEDSDVVEVLVSCGISFVSPLQLEVGVACIGNDGMLINGLPPPLYDLEWDLASCLDAYSNSLLLVLAGYNLR